jgi:hypothetical protein
VKESWFEGRKDKGAYDEKHDNQGFFCQNKKSINTANQVKADIVRKKAIDG